MLLSARNLLKHYPDASGQLYPALALDALTLDQGEEIAVTGPSGAGKSTLLHILAGLLPPDQGELSIDGVSPYALSESRRDRWRAENIGFIFQEFHLLPHYTIRENILLGMTFGGRRQPALAGALLEATGLLDKAGSLPRHLSVGQRQRAAVARALANQPRLLLADEPTGSLDPENAQTVLTLLRQLARDHQTSLIVVSHDPTLVKTFPRTLQLHQPENILAS